jgi:general secretion pathway protein G
MKYNRLMKLVCLILALSVTAMTGWASNGPRRAFAAKTDLSIFTTALKVFHDDFGRYPTTSEGLEALINPPVNVPPGKWHKGLDVDRFPNDPWGHAYVYCCPGVHNTNSFDIYSCGPDGKSKSGGNDPDDINNWNPLSPLVTANVAEQFPRFAFFCAAALFLLVLTFACLEKRIMEPQGNLHGAFALLWIAVTPFLWMALTWTLGAGVMEYSHLIGAFGWAPPFVLLTISGYRRGTPFSKACVVMTIPVLILAGLTIPTL